VRAVVGAVSGVLLGGILMALLYSVLPSETCYVAAAGSCKVLSGRQYADVNEFLTSGPAPLAYFLGLVGGGLAGIVTGT
jgi:hypothetical protein